jgi:hypothetical protein
VDGEAGCKAAGRISRADLVIDLKHIGALQSHFHIDIVLQWPNAETCEVRKAPKPALLALRRSDYVNAAALALGVLDPDAHRRRTCSRSAPASASTTAT